MWPPVYTCVPSCVCVCLCVSVCVPEVKPVDGNLATKYLPIKYISTVALSGVQPSVRPSVRAFVRPSDHPPASQSTDWSVGRSVARFITVFSDFLACELLAFFSAFAAVVGGGRRSGRLIERLEITALKTAQQFSGSAIFFE